MSDNSLKFLDQLKMLIRLKHYSHRISFNKQVYVKVGRFEKHIQRIVKSAGGTWHPDKGFWQMRYGDVSNLGLTARIRE